MARMLAEHWGQKSLVLPPDTLDLSPVSTDIASITQLLRRMPADRVYVRVPGAQPGSGQPARMALSDIDDLATRLKQAEPLHVLGIDLHLHDEGFAEVLRRFTQKIARQVPEVAGPLSRHTVGLFLSTPGVVAPFHADQEHNFLCQAHGDKKMHMFSGNDLSIFSSEARERLAVDDIHALDTYRPELERDATVVHLQPGTVLYHPPLSPHWVDTGKDSYSLSFSFTFITASLDRLLLLHKINSRLRRLGLTPSPVGDSPAADSVKTAAARGLRSLRRVISN